MPRRGCLMLLLAGLAGCGGSGVPRQSSLPSPTSSPDPERTLRGQVVDVITGEPVVAKVEVWAVDTVQTDALGRFAVKGPFTPSSRVSVFANGYLPRDTWVEWTPQPTIDVIPDAAPFDLAFYRQLVRDGLDQASSLRSLRRWTRAPMIYLRTVDEAGDPIPVKQLDSTETALRQAAPQFTGAVFGIAGIERGGENRVGLSGWITVQWLGVREDGICGRAQVAVDGGAIWLNYRNPSCGCDGLKMRPRTVKHELGHALGFWHTDSIADLMYGRGVGGCDADPSMRERLHAGIAYRRAPGNLDIDRESPFTSPLSLQSMRWPVIEIID